MAILTPTLQLGDFIFTGVEEPESLKFGKEQSAHKHVLIGGGRVIDLLGAGDPDISWTGFFTGFQAPFRARFMETLVTAAKPLLLKTSSFVKQVVITSFSWDYHKVWPIQYTITVQVIQDQTQPINFQVPGDITDAILNSILEAQDLAILIADGSINSAIAIALIAADNASPFTSATNVELIAALSAAQGAQTAIANAITIAEKGLFGGISSAPGLPQVGPLPDLAAEAIALNELQKLYQLQDVWNSYVIKNILLVGSAPQSQVVTLINPNLYRVAVQYYGDANSWTVIANANSLTDPKQTGIVVLLIPPASGVDSGGVLNP
jgi:hypothetical protein